MESGEFINPETQLELQIEERRNAQSKVDSPSNSFMAYAAEYLPDGTMKIHPLGFRPITDLKPYRFEAKKSAETERIEHMKAVLEEGQPDDPRIAPLMKLKERMENRLAMLFYKQMARNEEVKRGEDKMYNIGARNTFRQIYNTLWFELDELKESLDRIALAFPKPHT